MVRETLKIRVDNGAGNTDPSFKGIELTEYQYKGSRMGMPELTATLMWPTCLDGEWTRKEYVVFNKERFYIRHTPSSSKSNTDERYKHDINFTSEFAEILGNTYFVDAVYDGSATYDKPCSNNTSFKFYGTIAEFVDRLNCAFRKAGIGDSALNSTTAPTLEQVSGDGFCAVLDPYGAGSQYDASKSYELSFEDKTLWEAVSEAYTITEIPFERRGRAIVFGALPVVVEHKFEYGHDNELLSVSKNNANAKVINRITMVGSTENIPYYYPNETEYGHIGIKTMSGNKVLTAGMIEIANMTQLLSRLNADTYAVLDKRDPDSVVDAEMEISGYASSFGNGSYSTYNLSAVLTHNNDGSRDIYSLWHIRVFFDVTQEGLVICPTIKGNSWIQGTDAPEEDQSLMDVVTPEALGTIEDNTHGIKNVDYFSHVEKDGAEINLGRLPIGKYFFQFSVKIQNCDRSRSKPVNVNCYLSKLELKAAPKAKAGYYWKVGDKEYSGISSLGVKITGEISGDMIGDGFGWEASGRMPTQESLAPPKYRTSLGEERFYNAVSGAYNDPDTGSSYVFPNPFVEGSPSEHIYRNENIKPTIEGVKNAEGQLMGEIASVAYDEGDNDMLKPDSEESDKNDALKYEHSFFYIKLNIFNGDYGFDLFKHASQTDAMTIQMTSGPCNGCKFKIQAAKFTDADGLEAYKNPVVVKDGVAVGVVSETGLKESDLDPEQQNTQTNSVWICVQKDANTFGVIMPNQSGNFKPQAHDTFNIINIDLPQSYITAAEKRLEEEGIRFMADNNEEKFTFDIQASRIFFADNPEVLEQLDEYSVIKVTYNGKEYERYVNQITVDCKENEALPNIGIDLTDTLAVGQSFIDNVAERASSLIANSATMGGGFGVGLNAALADKRYVNKTRKDRTPYALNVGDLLTAETGAHFGDFVQGRFTGRGAAIDVAGNGEFESITVRGSLKVMALIFNRLNAQEGNTSFADSGTIELIFSQAGSSCMAQLRRRWEGDFTAFQPGDIVYGYVNNLDNVSGREHYKAWAWIRSVDRANNQLSLAIYPDSEVPEGRNYPMAEGMMITRWGNMIEANETTYASPAYNSFIGRREKTVTNDDGSESVEYDYYNKRQSSFYISCDDGNIVELMGVNKPILERYNYGTILGAIPDGLLDKTTQELINPNHPYLFARGIIVQDLIRIDYEGVPTRTANYRGVWNPYTAASDTEYYRSVDTTYDVVTWDGALWQCVVSHADDEEPSDESASWVKMTAGISDNELRIWTIIPSTNFVSVRSDKVVPSILSASVMLNSSIYSPTVFTSNYALSEEGVQLYYSVDGENWQIFVIGVQEPLDLEDNSGVIELEDSVDDSKILTVGGDDIDTDTIGDRIYFELRTLPKEGEEAEEGAEEEEPKVLSIVQVPVIRDGERGAFQSTVFIRTNEEPETPTGGTYDSPIPTSTPLWSDGIPEGEEILWASTRVFDLRIETTWDKPQQMTDTATYDVEFSNIDDDPGYPDTNEANWFDPIKDKDLVDFTAMIWRAERQKKNGVWGPWTRVRIKGEKGAKQSTVFMRTNEEPDKPTGGTYDSPIPTSVQQFPDGSELAWSESIPEGEEILWATTRIFEEHPEEETEWEDPRQMTDTATYDVEFSNVEKEPGNPTTNRDNWFDPDKDKDKVDFTKMFWRAERVKKNGLWGPWTIVWIKGTRGAFQSMVFLRSNEVPDRPTGGTYNSPIPTSTPLWSDGIPEGEEILWVSTRTFDENTETVWSSPRQMTDTETYDVAFSNVVDEEPGDPDTEPYYWFDPVEDKGKVDFTTMVWRAERIKKNGDWGDWTVVRIKGEKGDPGPAGSWVSYVFKQSETKPDAPTGTSVIPSGWMDAPDSEGIWWMSKATINGATGEAGAWSDPIKVTGEDGADGPYTDFKYLDSHEGDTVTLSETGKKTRHPSGWMDVPPQLDEGFVLWMIQAEVNADNTLKTDWSDPVRISGEKGSDGQPGADGNPGPYTDFKYAIEIFGETPMVYDPTDPDPEGWYSDPPEVEKGYSLWMIKAQKDHEGNLIGIWSDPVRISGDKGDRGTEGLLVYPAGFYDKYTAYFADEDTLPVVMYGDEDTGEYNYFRLKAGAVYQGALKPSDRDTPAKDFNKDDADTVWVKFDPFDSIFANIIMANFAKLGAAVFYGNWMISQQGLLNGQPSDQYQHFKDENSTFDPNFAVNYETGELWAEKAFIKGHVEAESGSFKGHIEADSGTFAGGIITRFKKVEESDAEYDSTSQSYILQNDLKIIVGTETTVELPTDIGYAGARAMICNNAKTYSRVPPPKILVQDAGCIYGLQNPDLSEAPISGAYTIKEISFLTGVIELVAVPNDLGSACDWFIVGNNSYYSEYQ